MFLLIGMTQLQDAKSTKFLQVEVLLCITKLYKKKLILRRKWQKETLNSLR